jgi:glucose/arabinose dehydrogenase
VASASYPIAMAVHPPTGTIWVALKGGGICRLHGGGCTDTRAVASVSGGSEQGLLGITFSPAGDRFYASYTDTAGDTALDQWSTAGDGAPTGAPTRIYGHDQPATNHNGGNVVFGPDGRLYLGLGDGGGAGDPAGNAQNTATDLGKVLRLDPLGGAGREHWLRGVRNPWRYSFDRATGDLWVADVGQGSWEEITFLPAGSQQGRNLGWSCFEGAHRFSSCDPAGGHTGPIFEYSHAEGCSITGGYVYRGSRIPDLVGAYLFADYCDGELRALVQEGGRVVAARRLGENPGNVVSFGQDAAGELYVLTPSGVLRIDPS